MKASWVYAQPVIELVIVDDTIVIAGKHAVVALDDQGRERWRRPFDRQPEGLTRCGRGIAFALPKRMVATQIAALDLDGNQLWQYDREWTLGFQGITGDRHGLALYGHDYGPPSDARWVGLDAATGKCRFDAQPPADAGPTIAGAWLIAPIDDGTGGIIQTDRDAKHPKTLTSISYVAIGTNDELVLLNTANESEATDVVAVELATGRERWRKPGGRNLFIEVDDKRGAWVEGSATSGRPVVHDLATGSLAWSGAPLSPISGRHRYRYRLGPDAMVCYAGYDSVVYYSLAASPPIHTRAWNHDEPSVSRFWGTRFLESGPEGLTCWELT